MPGGTIPISSQRIDAIAITPTNQTPLRHVQSFPPFLKRKYFLSDANEAHVTGIFLPAKQHQCLTTGTMLGADR